MSDVAEKIDLNEEHAELGDAEENLLWRPQNTEVHFH